MGKKASCRLYYASLNSNCLLYILKGVCDDKSFVLQQLTVTMRYTVKPAGQNIRPVITIVAITVTEPDIYKGAACYDKPVRNTN
jgi:hypothetical protein